MPSKAATATTERELTAMERLLHLRSQEPGPAGSPPEAGVREIPLDQLRPNPAQPRVAFDEATLEELADSLRARGVIQPLVVRPHPEEPDCFQIVVGERRFLAAGRAGLPAVPCLVRTLDDRETFLLSVAENVAREALNPIDEASAYRRMLEEQYAANQGEIAQLIGVHRTRVSRKLKLLGLDPRIQDDVRQQPAAAVSLTHLEELSRLRPGDDQHLLYLAVLDRGLSTRELQARVEARLAPPAGASPGISKSILALEGGARIAIYPNKYTLRVPRQAGDEVDLPRIVADLERILAELRSRL